MVDESAILNNVINVVNVTNVLMPLVQFAALFTSILALNVKVC